MIYLIYISEYDLKKYNVPRVVIVLDEKYLSEKTS